MDVSSAPTVTKFYIHIEQQGQQNPWIILISKTGYIVLFDWLSNGVIGDTDLEGETYIESIAGIALSCLYPSGLCDRCCAFFHCYAGPNFCTASVMAAQGIARERWRTQCQLGHRWIEHEVTDISAQKNLQLSDETGA